MEVKKKCKYDSYHNIPALVFFDIRSTGDYGKMRPKPGVKVEQLKAIFIQIYDDYFIKLDNQESKDYIALINREAFLETFLIPILTKWIKSLWEFPVELWEEERFRDLWAQQVEAVNKHLQEPIDINGILHEEFSRTVQVELGILENELNETKMELERLRADVSKTAFEFYDSLQNINEMNVGGQISSKCLLAEYVAAEKSAIKKNEREKLRQAKNGK